MTARRQFAALIRDRLSYTERAERNARYTIPSLFRNLSTESTRGSDDFEEPYQSLGAEGTMNLAAKFLLTILPFGHPFIRLEVNRWELEQRLRKAQGAGLPPSDPDKAKAEIEESLEAVTAEISAFTETIPMLRPKTFEHFQHLIVTGNHLLEFGEGDAATPMRISGHNLNKYALDRDKSDNMTELVLKERISRRAAPERVRALMMPDQEEVEIFTVVERVGEGRWEARQEVNDNVVEGTEGFFNEFTMPFLAGRFDAKSEEPYGRSWIEHLFGDLRSFEGFSQALLEMGAAAAKLIPMVDPNSGVSLRRLATHRNGEYLAGRADAVSFVTVGKQPDAAFAVQQWDRLRQRLERGFLLASAIQRDAERVTAEEIRLMSQELQSTFGGTFAALSESFQRPLAYRMIHIMQKRGMIPKLPRDLVRVSVVAGLGTLGRGRDLADLQQGIGTINQLFGPGGVQMLDQREGVSRVLQSVGIDGRNLLKTRERLAQEQQAAQQAKMAEDTAPELVRQTGQIAQKSLPK